jgi:hypothetical protein
VWRKVWESTTEGSAGAGSDLLVFLAANAPERAGRSTGPIPRERPTPLNVPGNPYDGEKARQRTLSCRGLDFALLLLLSAAVGLNLVAHVTLVIGLLRREPRWRGLVGLLVPPLAAYWGYEAKLRGRVTLWVASLAVYLVSATAAAL